jgi:hypothetical protein
MKDIDHCHNRLAVITTVTSKRHPKITGGLKCSKILGSTLFRLTNQTLRFKTASSAE